MENELLKNRRDSSRKRLDELRQRIATIDELKKAPNLSIYVTGSYGRLEASTASDLDLFFIKTDNAPIGRITKTLIDAELIKIAREMEFPPFSNEGQYLEIHSLNEMLKNLGGPQDDFKNFFTARLLMLLEGRPLYDELTYKTVLGEIVAAYFRDYHDHVADFHPLFLVNDILRFWKTLCLNYENKRNRPATDVVQKNKSHAQNFKLKFSRLSICFSTVIPLIAAENVSPDAILRLTTLPPLERLKQSTEENKKGESTYGKILNSYAWFLETTARPNLNEWIGDPENRKLAFSKADEFGDLMYSLLTELVHNTDKLRFLII